MNSWHHAVSAARKWGGTEEDDYNYTLRRSGHPSLGRVPSQWDVQRREYVYGPYEGTDEARYLRVKALSDAISSGAFDDVLLEAFGDHAKVTVTAQGITVRECSHD